LHLSVNNRAAVGRANAVMREHGLDPDSFHKAAQFVDATNPLANEYLRRRLSIAQINKIYAERVPGALWRVRYFRDSQPEEFAIVLKPDGSFHAFRHTLAEAAKGANLSKEDAQSVAEKFLREKKQIDLAAWKLVEANSEKRPKRTDHTLTWQQVEPLDAENAGAKDSADHAYARIDVQVLGDEPANYRTYVKIPEEFTRKQGELTLPRTLFVIGKYALFLGLAICILVFYFLRLRSQPAGIVPWRRLTLWGLAGGALFLGSFLLGKGIPALLMQYPTALSLRMFFATFGVGIFLITALISGGLVLLFGLAWSFGARAFGSEKIPTWLGMPADYYRDAFWIAVGGGGILIGLRRLLGMLDVWWPTLHRELPASFGESFDALYPAAGIVGGALVRGLLLTGTFALAAAFLGAELRVRWLRLVLFITLAAALVSDWGSAGDFMKQFLTSLLIFGAVVFGFRRVVRFNLLGCLLAVVSVALLGGTMELVSQSDGFYRTQGHLVLTALVLLLSWPLVAWRINSERQAPT